MENSITLRAVKAAIAILSVTTCFGAAARAAGAFDATGDFSIASNPNGVWSYLESTTLFSLSKTEAGGGIQFWNSGLPEPNYISIYKNITSAPIAISTIVAQPGTLVMDPESQTVTVAFTAPTTGKYDVSGTFTGADTNENCQRWRRHLAKYHSNLPAIRSVQPYFVSNERNHGGLHGGHRTLWRSRVPLL